MICGCGILSLSGVPQECVSLLLVTMLEATLSLRLPLAGWFGLVLRARQLRLLWERSKSGHPLIPFWCKCAGMLLHCAFSIKRVMSHRMTFRFRQHASRLQTSLLTKQFRLLV